LRDPAKRIFNLKRLAVEEKEKHSGRLYEVFAQWKPVSICEVHCQQAVDDVRKGLHFEWLEDAKQLPCHLPARPENGGSFPGTTSVEDS